VLALEYQSGSALATSWKTIAVEAELFLNHGEPGSYPVQTRVGSRASDLETEYACQVCGPRWEIHDEGSGAA
jgi:hypothetical protein